jgi:GH15 family glucan-1,4-alpha-glucosidase
MRDLVEHSIKVITREQAPSGAYPACSNFPVYGFAWLRDGAFVADSMRAHGVVDGARAFHEWTAQVLTDRAERIEAVVAALTAGEEIDQARFLPTRYTLDGADGSESWWDFQLDGYGTWLWALQRHLDGGTDRAFAAAVTLTVRYLCAAWRLPCYDWWEEHAEQVHLATLASVEAGLRAALRTGLLGAGDAGTASSTADAIAAVIAAEGSVDGRLRKWLGSDAVDGALLAAVAPFRVVDDATARRTVAAVERDLLDGGGVHRFRADVFYGGGRWPVLAGLLGQAYLRLGRPADAHRQLAWIAGTAAADGDLPEQVSDRLLHPQHRQEWLQRWGPVATPLLWSHAAYLSLAAELGVTL